MFTQTDKLEQKFIKILFLGSQTDDNNRLKHWCSIVTNRRVGCGPLPDDFPFCFCMCRWGFASFPAFMCALFVYVVPVDTLSPLRQGLSFGLPPTTVKFPLRTTMRTLLVPLVPLVPLLWIDLTHISLCKTSGYFLTVSLGNCPLCSDRDKYKTVNFITECI